MIHVSTETIEFPIIVAPGGQISGTGRSGDGEGESGVPASCKGDDINEPGNEQFTAGTRCVC